MKSKASALVTILTFLMSVLITSLSSGVTNASDGGLTTSVVLGGTIAPLAKGVGTNEKFYWGSGCWAAVIGQKFEIYIDPTLPPFNTLDTFTVDDIASISYYTNTPHPITGTTPHNFYLVIYTKPDGVNDHGWYGYKLIGEPYFSKNLDAPANQWNAWNTDAGTNQLTFFDPDTIGFYGFYGQPTLQDIQAGSINWYDYYSGCPTTNIDYGVEVIKYISFQTSTAMMSTFQGYIDAITIALNDGTTVLIDLEGFASEVWIDDDWTSLPPGYEVEPGKFIGYNAFAKIQDGINAVIPDGIVHVYPGVYTEQVIINKDLSLEGMPGAKIFAPDTRSTFTIPESSAILDPIIFVYGSLSGTETISVDIKGFEIDGGNKATSSYRYVGLLCRNVKPGTISNNVIERLYPPSGMGSGPQTFGILVYGDSEVAIDDCEIRDFSRGGIGILGDAASNPDPRATIQQTDVFGNGLETETGWWAENGIQVAYGATANIIGNNVYNCTVNNPSWSATGIMAVDTNGVTIENNYVEGCDIGIAAVDFPESKYGAFYHLILSNVAITGNTLVGNTWQIDISNDARNVIVTYNNIINATEDGVDVWSYTGVTVYPTNVKVNYNNIMGSGTYGVWVDSDVLEQVDARYNWWGDPSGPYHPTLNPTGTGDAVSGYLNFDHWLLEEYPPPLPSPVLYVDPVEVEYWTLAYGETFEVSIKIEEVTNLAGYEFKLYWDTSLLDLVSVEITPPWPEGNCFLAKNYTDESAGLYWLGVGSYMIGPFSGSTTLAKLTFKIMFDPVYPENATCMLDLADTKLSAPAGEKIYHIAYDGKYAIYSTKPKIEVKPPEYAAHKIGEIFTVDICVSDIVNLYNYTFKLHYDTVLLDAINLEIGPFLNPPIYAYKFIIDDANGEIWLWVWSTSGTPVSGSGVLATITFKVTKATTWTKYHPNTLECALDLYDTKLITHEGVEVLHDVVGGVYRYEPKPGDLDCDGQVNLVDLRTVAYYYDPAYNSIADLNEDGIVDIYDLQIVAYYYGGDC